MCDSCGCQQHDHDHTAIVLPVSGMTCGHCQKAVEIALADLTGIHDVKVDLEAGTVSFAMHSGADLNAVKEAIREEGFQVL